MKIFGEGKESDKESFEKLKEFWRFFGGKEEEITEAFVIQPTPEFEAKRIEYFKKHEESPTLFQKRDYLEMEDKELRKRYLEHLNKKIAKFPQLQEMGKTNILPMIQGTNLNASQNISESGFGITATTDPGWYGQGSLLFPSILTFHFPCNKLL